jgi:hypothetical protein
MSTTTTEEKTYGVFVHSSGKNGGYVVRTMYNGWTPSPYSSSLVLRAFRRESAAQRHADNLNTVRLGL